MTLSAAEAALRAWIETSGGFIHRHVTLMHDTKEKGHAVLANSTINDGEVVLAIPLALCLHSRRHSEQVTCKSRLSTVCVVLRLLSRSIGDDWRSNEADHNSRALCTAHS